MKRTSRRDFLATARDALAGAATLSLIGAGEALGANERINIGLIGCGGRGRYVAYGMAALGARVNYLCDLMPSRREGAAKFIERVQKEPPKLVADMRALFDDKNLDAVVVATPDHWHAPATIMACQAGKDVYVEKPASHNIWESTKMIEAARKYGRVVQVGTQNRSAPYNFKARDYIRSGKLGKVCLVQVYNLKPGGPFRLGDPGKQPEGFDWDRWLGRASYRPYHQRIFRSGWQHFWDFCGGDMGNDGIHQIDLALMMMGDPGFPKSVRCVGGRYAYRGDDSETPDVEIASYDFGSFVMTFEMTNYPRYMRKTTGTIRRNDLLPYWTQNATRIEFYGSELLMILGRHGGGWVVMTSGGKVVEKTYGRPGDEPHYRNFLECVKSRKRPTADIAIAHLANTTMHMGNIAHRVGNTVLRYDPKTGKFDDPEANRLIKPLYRKGYEIPEKV